MVSDLKRIPSRWDEPIDRAAVASEQPVAAKERLETNDNHQPYVSLSIQHDPNAYFLPFGRGPELPPHRTVSRCEPDIDIKVDPTPTQIDPSRTQPRSELHMVIDSTTQG